MLGEEEEAEDPCKRQWLNNYELNEVNVFSLFNEYLEIGTWGRSLAGEQWMQGRSHTKSHSSTPSPSLRALGHQDHPQNREQATVLAFGPASDLLSFQGHGCNPRVCLCLAGSTIPTDPTL